MFESIRVGRSRPLIAIAAALGVAMSLSACSSDDAPDASGVPTLKVAVGSNALSYGAFWAAEADELFAKHGVKVDVVNANALAVGPSLLASGKVDVLLSASGQSVALAATGKPVSIVFNMYNYTPRGGSVVGSKDITSFDQLRDRGSDCKLVTTQKGTGTYALAKQVQRAYDLDCKVTALATNALTVTSMTSGQADVGIFTPVDGAAVVAKGGNYLLDPAKMTDEEVSRIVPEPFPALAVSGQPKVLAAKKVAVERFLSALRDGLETIADSTPDELAGKFSKLPHFPNVTPEMMASSMKPSMSAFPTGPDAGLIAKDDWDAALTSFGRDFDLPGFDKNAPAFTYDALVDDSFLK